MRTFWLQHVPFEGLGRIENWFRDRGISPVRIRMYAGDPLPDPRKVDFLVVMGGPMSVNDTEEYPWIEPEKDFLRKVIAEGARVLGVCLGAQLIASSLGANVYGAESKEIGWWKLARPVGASSDPLLSDSFPVFHWHGETFDLPPGAELLASSAGCINQAFRIGGKIIGTQFHLETTPATAEALVRNCRNEIEADEPYIQSEEEILAAPEGYYQKIGEQLDLMLESLFENEQLTDGVREQVGLRVFPTPDH